MFCTNCGNSVQADTAFCPACGARMDRAPAPPAIAPTPAGAGPFPTNYPPVSMPPAGASVQVRPPLDYATWATRAVGYLIDTVLILAATIVLYFFAGGMLAGVAGLGSESLAQGICCMFVLLFPVASLAVGLYNRVYLVSKQGFSIGQGVVKVKVIDANGHCLSQGTALIRLLAQVAMGFVPMLPLLDLLWPLWDPYRQTLHDKAVGCYVVNNPQGI